MLQLKIDVVKMLLERAHLAAIGVPPHWMVSLEREIEMARAAQVAKVPPKD